MLYSVGSYQYADITNLIHLIDDIEYGLIWESP